MEPVASNYVITVNDKSVRSISTNWDSQPYFVFADADKLLGHELADAAYAAIKKLAADGHCAYGRCHLAAIWPDGVRIMPDGRVSTLGDKDRMQIFSIVLRRIMKIGLNNYNQVVRIERV